MKKAQISAIRLIADDKKGNAINLAVIETADGATSIVRSLKEFKTDLDNSGLLKGDPSYMNRITHPAIKEAAIELQEGTVKGDFRYVKKGEMYEVTKDSLVITNPNHPEYGNYSVGDKRPRTADGVIVDGFLSLGLSYENKLANKVAKEMAAIQMEVMGLFNSSSTSSQASDSAADLPEFDEDATAAALGSESLEETTKEESAAEPVLEKN